MELSELYEQLAKKMQEAALLTAELAMRYDYGILVLEAKLRGDIATSKT